jgi:predicted PurR-regulated permease PerM
VTKLPTQHSIEDRPGHHAGVPRALERSAAIAWRFVVLIAAAWFVVVALVRLRVVVLPVIIALLLSTLLAPLASWLAERGWPKLLATWTVVVGFLVLLTGIVVLLAPQVGSEMSTLGRDVREGSERVLEWLAEGPLELSQQEVNRYVDQAAEQLRANSSTITSGVLAGAVAVGEIVAGLLLTLVLVFFFVKDGKAMVEWTTSRLRPDQRHHARALSQRAWRALGSYVRGTALIAFVDAVLIGIALIVIGVPLVAPLMLLTFLGGFFPLVGAVLAGAVAALVALVSGGVLDALLVAGAVTIIQQVEGDVLQPVVLGRAVRLHPVVVLLSLTAGAVLGGVAGAFLAVPVTAVATAVGGYVREQSGAPHATSHEGGQP